MNRGTLGALWGVTGVLLLLASAVGRLAGVAGDAWATPWTWYHWVTFIIVVAGMAYAEGYRGFQQAFAPRVAARARYLRERPVTLPLVFAPLFCMGYFHATRRRQITSWSLTLGIIALVIGVRYLVQPWRGIIDAGVVVGLAWGVVAVGWFAVRGLTAPTFAYSPEVPANAATAPANPGSSRANAS